MSQLDLRQVVVPHHISVYDAGVRCNCSWGVRLPADADSTDATIGLYRMALTHLQDAHNRELSNFQKVVENLDRRNWRERWREIRERYL